ncbi:MAG: hypothetical protein JWM11_4902 [Planctomycetaceae bacterium]|nr:hypothetical protein [Planctomycetaceae bacterium]
MSVDQEPEDLKKQAIDTRTFISKIRRHSESASISLDGRINKCRNHLQDAPLSDIAPDGQECPSYSHATLSRGLKYRLLLLR